MFSSTILTRPLRRVGKYLDIFVNVLIISVVIFYSTYNNNNNSFNNDHIIPSDNNYHISDKEIRQLSNFETEYPLVAEKLKKENQKKSIIGSLLQPIYRGKWNTLKSDFSLGNSITGDFFLQFGYTKEIKTGDDILIIFFRCLEDKYIDNWLKVIGYGNINKLLSNITYDNEEEEKSKIMKLSSNFSMNYEKGELFSKRGGQKSMCDGQINMTFPMKLFQFQIKNALTNESTAFNVTSINSSLIDIQVSTNCGFNFDLQGSVDKITLNEYIDEINNYVWMTSLSTILTIISTLILSRQLSSREQNLSSISLITLSQNILWHSYCCMSHITFGLTFPYFLFKFFIIMGLNLFSYSLIDLRLLFTYWRVKARIAPVNELFKSRMKFYAFFYAAFFSFFFFLTKFFYEKTFITIMLILMWVPQIISNVINNNKSSLPLIYILASSIDRIVIPYYFRGYNNNFTRIRGDPNFIVILSVIVVITIVIMYLQLCFGPRFFLPCKINDAYDYYKTKEELLACKPNAEEEDCVICLCPLFKEEEEQEIKNNNKKSTNNDKEHLLKVDEVVQFTDTNSCISSNTSTASIQNDNTLSKQDTKLEVIDNKNKDDIIEEPIKSNPKRIEKVKNILWTIYEIVFCFYRRKANIHNKKYMITPCHHCFHTKCLEAWFSRKKECPNCRAEMVD